LIASTAVEFETLLKAGKMEEKTWGKKKERKRGYRMKVWVHFPSILRVMMTACLHPLFTYLEPNT
jgi:hypothetical protein